MSIKYHIVSYAVLGALLAPMVMAAQTDASDNDFSIIETVVVTAQKREQNPVDVPMALTTYSGDFMKDIGIQEFDKLSLFVPGFQVQNQAPDSPGFVMRGVTSDSIDATSGPRVSVFQDGVSISRAPASYVELFDITRVEIAKGPQSTLFGRGALIGGVNVITNHANPDAFAAAASVETGNYGYRMADGMVNIPIDETLAVRVSGRYKARDGYVKNLLGGRDFYSLNTSALRGSVNWQPTKNFSADLIVNFEHDSSSGTPFKSNTIMPTDPTTGQVLGNLSPNTGATLATVSGFEHDKPIGMNRSLYSVTGLTNYKIDNSLTLSSITAYRRFDVLEICDIDGSSLPLIAAAADGRGDQYSHEFRLNYDQGGMISAFVGASYFYESTSTRTPTQYNEPMMLALLTGQINRSSPQSTAFFGSSAYAAAYAPAYIKAIAAKYGVAMDSATASGIAANLQTNHWEQYETYGKDKSADLYADATLHATENLEFSAGIRYSHDDKVSSYRSSTSNRSVIAGLIAALKKTGTTQTYLLKALSASGAASLSTVSTAALPNFGFAAQPTVNNGDKISKGFSDDGFTWRLTARYTLEPESNLYATYARGRRPMELSASSPAAPYASPTFTPVAAETVDSYEFGYKTVALAGTLHIDTAVYFYNYNNFRTTMKNGAELVTTNAGKANSYGFESAVAWAASDRLDIFATYTYGRARFGGQSVYKGNQFRLTPDHKASIGASLRQNALGGVFTFLPTYTWQSKIYFDDNNDRPDLQTANLIPDTVQDELQRQYGLLSLHLSYQPENKPWSVSLFATNVLDQKYIKDAGNTGDIFGTPTFIAGEPRFFGVNFSIKTE